MADERLSREMLSYEELRNVLSYDAETGILQWKVRPSNRISVGDHVGNESRSGYLKFGFKGRDFYVHRVAFLLYTGEWPSACIDHINGIRGDNRWCNLREANVSENNRNVRVRSDNSSGIKGVSWKSRGKKWVATIGLNGRKRHLGCYSDMNEAAEVVELVREMAHGNFSCHG